MPPTVIVATTTLGDFIGTLLWNAVAGVVMLVAVIRVVTVAAEAWPRQRWSKAGWIVAALWVSWYLGGLLLPVGAIVALVQGELCWSRWRLWWFTTAVDWEHTFEGLFRFFEAVGGVPKVGRTDRMGALGVSQGKRFRLHAPTIDFVRHHGVEIRAPPGR